MTNEEVVLAGRQVGKNFTKSMFERITVALLFQGVEPYEWVERDGILYARCRPGGCLWDTGVALRFYDKWKKEHPSKKALASRLRWMKVQSVKDAWDIDEKTILKERLYDDDRLQRWIRRNTDWQGIE